MGFSVGQRSSSEMHHVVLYFSSNLRFLKLCQLVSLGCRREVIRSPVGLRPIARALVELRLMILVCLPTWQLTVFHNPN